MAQKILRPRKDGGFSMCCCPDELVGKGRCQHVLGLASLVYKDGNVELVDMEGKNLDVDNNQNISNYLSKISTAIPDETKQKLIKIFTKIEE